MLPIFEVVSLSKVYHSASALKGINLTIEKGDIYGIIGLSGAGKSTLIRTLSRLVEPTSGKVLYQGIDLASLTTQALRAYRKRIGMIFQHFNLLSSRTVAENIAYPLEIAGISDPARVDELLTLVGLLEKKNAYPSQLSGGEKQRVGIARALASNPEVLLCDEATSALDPKTTKEVLDLLKAIHQKLNITIVLITHEMKVIRRICNKVAVIEKGAIIESGAVKEIFAHPRHPTTKRFLQDTSHELPPEFFKEKSSNCKLLRLKFTGQTAEEPHISYLVKHYAVDANILLGWIDHVQSITIGTLVIELTGALENIQKSLSYLASKGVYTEELIHE